MVKNARYWIRLSKNGTPVEGSLISRTKKPEGRWMDITNGIGLCCSFTASTLEVPATFVASADSSPAVAIDLAWAAVPNADSYLVEKSLSSTFASGITTVYAGTATNTVATGLTTGTTYYFRIKAIGFGFNTSSHKYTSRATT